ncbi:hypothetical protein GCM10008107_09460 [Psychrosphaera saromensis]|uniref:Cellulose synthase operon C C-terminal domain-containing protein n=1 Tax=Psychrosphaera saromensis TaxID=716813 RepID=A0A2S7UW77_9GAMM|nr:cellulose synthase subunit BcsC-related outer membrane protein [Psychrosphaera saromensis]PQJ53762.1 hypothetical protein BTO11_08875 [Psychrosphaera saromensis]GHB62489.1 hypothetical protein GCM10008107_09460 [Psychrosphaera saromensis]GLQ15449.1 hypothetical protein GCM10007917_29040 [Psychrosphaera saromensis]
MKSNWTHWFASLIFCSALIITFPVKSNEQGIVYLLEQLSFQMGQRDLFQAEQTLIKISKVAPENLVYLQENIRFLAESQRFSQARIKLLKIKPRISERNHSALLQLIDIYQNKRKDLSDARLLNTRQLYQQSLNKYDQLFDKQDPHYSLALEYWDILTEVSPDLEPTVLYKLQRLNQQYPANPRIKLAYFKYSLRAGKNKNNIYDELYLLTFNTVWQFEAKRLWQYGLMNTDVTHNNQQNFKTYIERFPDDNRVGYHFRDGNAALEQHRISMRDPAYRAKVKLPKMLEDDAPLSEIALTLATAKTKYADDQDVIIAEGRFLFRKNDYVGAKAAFNRCIELFEPTPSVCLSLIITTDYWALIEQTETYLDSQQFDQAGKTLTKLYQFKDESNYHILLDGNRQVGLGNYVKAEQLYQSLLAVEPLSSQFLVTMMEFKLNYKGKLNMDTWVSNLTLQQKDIILPEYNSLLVSRIRDKADAELEQGNEQEAESLLKSALRIVQMHPWASYDLAKLYIQQGEVDKALSLYKPISSKVEVKYSYSLILASVDMYYSALNVLQSIPSKSRTNNIKQDIQDYKFELAMEKVDRSLQQDRLALLTSASSRFNSNVVYISRIQQQMLKYGFLQQSALLAKLLLDSNQKSDSLNRINVLLQLAQVQLLAKQPDKAVNNVALIYKESGRSFTNELALSDLTLELLEDNQLPQVIQSQFIIMLDQHLVQHDDEVAVWKNDLRFAELTSDVVRMWHALDKLIELEPTESYRFYQLFSLFEENKRQLNVSNGEFKYEYLVPFIQSFPFDPVGYDVAFRLYNQLPELGENSGSLMKKGYYSALMADISDSSDFDTRVLSSVDDLVQKTNSSNLNANQKQKMNEYLQLMNSDGNVTSINVGQGSWLVNRFQSALTQRSLKENRRLELGVKKYDKSGSAGTSEYDLSVLSLTYAAPMDNAWLGSGEWYVKVEPTIIKAGTLDTNDSATDTFGFNKLCDSRCDDLLLKQEEVGTSIAIGFENSSVSADIGTKPIGFKLFDWVGGAAYSNSLWNIGWTLGVSKRSVTSSLLSFAGSEDPYTSTTWGGTSLYNLGLSLSYDQGAGWGIWALTDAGKISGKQVKDNERTRAMGGIYWDWFERDWLTASVGLNLFTWQYEKDLSEFTFGQSGYYSPQEYKSASLPLNFYGRLGDFTYQVDLSVSKSESADDDSIYYPQHANYQQVLEQISNDNFLGGKSTGEGFSAEAMIEYKLTNHWTLGTNITIQKSEYFSPNSLYFYVKYYFEPNLQPANRRPNPVSIYMDY